MKANSFTGLDNDQSLFYDSYDYKFIDTFKSNVYFIQEYQTFEDAYRVALDMRETNPKCYNQ